MLINQKVPNNYNRIIKNKGKILNQIWSSNLTVKKYSQCQPFAVKICQPENEKFLFKQIKPSCKKSSKFTEAESTMNIQTIFSHGCNH